MNFFHSNSIFRNFGHVHAHRWELSGNYSYFYKIWYLPLYLENYEWFSLPLLLSKKLQTDTLSNIIYLGEPLGNILSNLHDTFIHIFMHGYYPIYQRKIPKPFFSYSCKKICLIGRHFFNSSPKFLNFDTLYDTLRKQICKTRNFLLVELQEIPLFQAVAASYTDKSFISSPKRLSSIPFLIQ